MSTKSISNSKKNSVKRCVVLCRVSTLQQSYDEQVNIVTKAAIADGYNEDEIVVVKGKESAIKLAEEERATLNEMKDIISKNPTIESIYVFAIDRLARRVSVILSVKDYLMARNINLTFLNPHRLSTMRLNDNGKKVEDELTSMMLMFLAYGAEMEMKIKKARFKAGKEHAKKLGRFTGGSVKYGYTLNEKKEIIVDEAKTNIINTIFDKYIEGQGNEAIANYMNEMGIACRKSKTYTRSRVSKFIEDEQYRKIVGDEKFEQAQAVRKANTKSSGKERKMSLGERLIKCPDCGRNYRLVGRNYVCSGHKAEYLQSGISIDGKALYCDNAAHINARWMDATLVQTVSVWYAKDVVEDDSARRDKIEKELKEIPFKIMAIEKQLEKISGKVDRILENYEEGEFDRQTRDKKMSAAKADEKELLDKKEALETRRRELESSREKIGVKQLDYLNTMVSVKDMTHSEIYEIVHALVERVDVEVKDGVKYWTIRKKNSELSETFFSFGHGCGTKLYMGTNIEYGIDVTNVEGYNREFKAQQAEQQKRERGAARTVAPLLYIIEDKRARTLVWRHNIYFRKVE